MTPSASAARQCNGALNPLHSMVYFAPEADREFTAVGLRPGGMAYLAGRSAAMGAVGAGTVAATFFNYNPAFVARHIPRAWELAAPTAVLAARYRVVDAALSRLLGADGGAGVGDPEVAEAAGLALTAAEACGTSGRPLYAAHAEWDVPKEPHLALWHAVTLLREHRGDGHIAALTAAGLDGLAALVSHTATGKGFLPQFARSSRGWSGEEWDRAVEGLRERGLLDGQGALTQAGEDLRRDVEATTDRLAAAPYEHLGETATQRLIDIGRRLTSTIVSNGAFPSGVFAASR